MLRISLTVLVVVALATLTSCSVTPDPGDPLLRRGDEISVCGRLFHTGAKVVLWNDPGGFDAYRAHRHFEPEKTSPSGAPERIARFGSLRRGLPPDLESRVRERGWTIADLRATVTQVVIHYDAAGSSKRCFKILQDVRGLSSHFLLDLDGTIYQTLDVKERAWHAGIANDRSVGLEIANLGAYPNRETLQDCYQKSDQGTLLGIVGFPPAVQGRVQGADLYQYAFTDAQYESLGRLTATLCRVLDIPARAPRTAGGQVRTTVFDSEKEIRDFAGILGHLHVSRTKVDPGPAFDWDRLFRALAGYGVR